MPASRSEPSPPGAATTRAVLLDVDGTLVDSNDAHAHAWIDALSEFNHPVSFERVRRLIGKGGDKLLPEVTDISAESTEGERISARRSQIFRQRYLPSVRAFPSARALLERMRADGLTLVVATSAQPKEMAPLIEIAGVGDLLYEATSSGDADSSKPDPDIVAAALAKAECKPEHAIMLGDTPYDITAAARARVGCVALRSGGWSSDELSGARAVFDDVRDLLAHYDASPFARLGFSAARGRVT